MAEKLAFDDRINKMEETEVYITVKDHKEGFPDKLSFHLMKPFKSYLGKISKNAVDKINKTLILMYQYQCKPLVYTTTVADCFKNVANKNSAASTILMWKNFTH